MKKVFYLTFVLSLWFSSLHAQSYDKLKSLQSLVMNTDYRHIVSILQGIPNLNKVGIRTGSIYDNVIEEDRLLIDISIPQVEYFRIKAKKSDFNLDQLTLKFDEKSIKYKYIFNSEGSFSRSRDDANKYNRMLSAGNAYELSLLNNIVLDKNAPWFKYFYEALTFAITQSKQKNDNIQAAFYSEEIKKLSSILPTLLKNGEFTGQIGDFLIKIRTKNKFILESIYYENKYGFSGYVCVEYLADVDLTQNFYCDDFFNWNHLINKNPTYELALYTINDNTFLRPTSELGEYLYKAKIFNDIFSHPLKSINGKSVSNITPKQFDEISKNADSLNIVLQNNKLYKINKLDAYDKVILGGAKRIGISPDIFF